MSEKITHSDEASSTSMLHAAHSGVRVDPCCVQKCIANHFMAQYQKGPCRQRGLQPVDALLKACVWRQLPNQHGAFRPVKHRNILQRLCPNGVTVEGIGRFGESIHLGAPGVFAPRVDRAMTNGAASGGARLGCLFCSQSSCLRLWFRRFDP